MAARRASHMLFDPNSTFTRCGLPGIEQIPYGIHMCHFYPEHAALVAAVVPFVAAGLERHECCFWLTPQSFEGSDARRQLEQTGVDVDAAVHSGALHLHDSREWYRTTAGMPSAAVIERWLDEEHRVLAEGFSALRVCGTASAVPPEGWPGLMAYEKAVNAAIHDQRILALCCYDSRCCTHERTLEVLRYHNCALDRPDAGWQIVTD